MSIKHQLRTFLWKFGYDISRFIPTSHPLARRKQIMDSYNIDIVLDVGANVGSYALQLREIGYVNKIVSFEPLSSALQSLKANSRRDQNWDVFNFALGDVDEKQTINISENSYSSSLLDMLPAHIKSAPQSYYRGKELIDIKKLDGIFDDLCSQHSNVYMKIDTQGFEHKVINGAESSLARINTVQIEMSIVPLYSGALLFDDMFRLMRDKDYTLIAIEPGFSDPNSGQLLQFDGIFHRF